MPRKQVKLQHIFWLAGLSLLASLITSCGANVQVPTSMEAPATATMPPVESPTPTESPTATEVVVAEPTAEEVADFTPETIPDRFTFFIHAWVKTTVEENGAEVTVWKTEDEGMENVSMRFVTLYEHYIKDMFVEQTDLGRFHLLVTPEAPFRLRFPSDPAESARIGETIIRDYLLPEMNEQDSIDAVRSGADVYSVSGHMEKNSLPNSGGSTSRHTPIYSEDGKVRIGELISVKGPDFSELGPFVNKDGSVIFGRFFRTTLLNDPRWEAFLFYASNIIDAGGLYETAVFPEHDFTPLKNYFKQVTKVDSSDGLTQGSLTPTP